MKIDAPGMLLLRDDPNAVRIIIDQLCVRDMGPADYVRTKHEVRDFVQSGDVEAAQTIIANARQRREAWQRAGRK